MWDRSAAEYGTKMTAGCGTGLSDCWVWNKNDCWVLDELVDSQVLNKNVGLLRVGHECWTVGYRTRMLDCRVSDKNIRLLTIGQEYRNAEYRTGMLDC